MGWEGEDKADQGKKGKEAAVISTCHRRYGQGRNYRHSSLWGMSTKEEGVNGNFGQ